MDVMARLLAAGSFSQTIADDSVRHKSVAAYIYRQLYEADEANVLHEEDMHVYGERPMTDPLQLVCCNICKKSIKDSQFAAHAELCRSLEHTKQTSLELDGSTRNRKPPRKERKKLSTHCTIGKRRRSESLDNIDTNVVQPHLNSQIRVTSSSTEVKELCRSLEHTEQTSSKLDGSTGNRKPPRKERKKLSTHCTTTAVGERRRSESLDNIDSNVVQSHLNSQIRVTSSSTEVKGNSTFVEAASMLDSTGTNPGNRDHQASIMHPPTKRHKLMASTYLPVLESYGSESGVTKTVSSTDGITPEDLLKRTLSEHADPNHKTLEQVHVQQQHVMKNDFPAPLATKMYYLQRTNRLRASIRHLYFQDLSEEFRTDVASPKISHGEMVALQDSYQKDLSHGEIVASQDSSQKDLSFEQMDTVLNKESHATMEEAQKSGHSLAKSSEISLLKARGLPSGGLSNQFLVDNVSRSAATHVGLTGSNFLPKSYSFASNTGNPLGTIQQPNGSVPVI